MRLAAAGWRQRLETIADCQSEGALGAALVQPHGLQMHANEARRGSLVGDVVLQLVCDGRSIGHGGGAVQVSAARRA